MIPLLFAQLCILQSICLGRDQSQIRIKSEVGTVKHVEALQFFFLRAQISSNVFLGLYPLLRCVLLVVTGGGGGSRRYNH